MSLDLAYKLQHIVNFQMLMYFMRFYYFLSCHLSVFLSIHLPSLLVAMSIYTPFQCIRGQSLCSKIICLYKRAWQKTFWGISVGEVGRGLVCRPPFLTKVLRSSEIFPVRIISNYMCTSSLLETI